MRYLKTYSFIFEEEGKNQGAKPKKISVAVLCLKAFRRCLEPLVILGVIKYFFTQVTMMWYWGFNL